MKQYAISDALNNLVPGTVSRSPRSAWIAFILDADRRLSIKTQGDRRQFHQDRGFKVVTVDVAYSGDCGEPADLENTTDAELLRRMSAKR